MWYGIDELFEKSPENGPYGYCGGNPVKYFDPDGRDRYIFNEDGTFARVIYKEEGEHYGYIEGKNIKFKFADPENDPQLVETIAEVSKNLGVERAMIVHGFDEKGNKAMDEISNIGKTKVAFLENNEIKTRYITPKDFGLEYVNPQDIAAPDSVEDHLKIIKNIVNNITETKKDVARMELSLMNSAAILYVADKVSSLEEGVECSRRAIEKGHVSEQLNKIIKYSSI